MAEIIVSIADVPGVGRPHFVATPDDQLGTFFIVRIKREPNIGGLEIPPSSRTSPGGREWVVAFSNACTHMGCDLISTKQSVDLQGTYLAGPCPCHMTTFDLSRAGMTVMGPATEALPQLGLQWVSAEQTMVRVAGWLQDRDVPYGLPYGRTA